MSSILQSLHIYKKLRSQFIVEQTQLHNIFDNYLFYPYLINRSSIYKIIGSSAGKSTENFTYSKHLNAEGLINQSNIPCPSFTSLLFTCSETKEQIVGSKFCFLFNLNLVVKRTPFIDDPIFFMICRTIRLAQIALTMLLSQMLVWS